MSVRIKCEDVVLIDPKTEIVDFDEVNSSDCTDVPTEFIEFPDTIEVSGVAEEREDVILDKLPRPVSALNCRQARSYLVKLLRISNGGQNPQYGNPVSKPPFWPDFYWPWERLTDVHTKPRGMEEPLLYSEMMKLAIERGYKYYGFDPENYWSRTVEESEPSPVVRGTPAPILINQVEKLGLPPKLPRPNKLLNCVQARTVLSKLLRYQQAGNNPVYGHPETKPPWWPDDCIRWIDMVDLRGKPPYLPQNMSYTDVLKYAIEKGLEYFGYDSETWVDEGTFSREQNVALISKLNKTNSQTVSFDEIPRLPIPINKMNCSVARTSLARLLRYHCGANPKYGCPSSMPIWWPNESFEWAALKNLSHRFEGHMGDSYSNCLRLALASGYEFYNVDPMTYVEELAETLPNVASKRITQFVINPQVSELIQKFDGAIESNLNLVSRLTEGSESSFPDSDEQNSCDNVEVKLKRPPPPLIPLSAVLDYSQHGRSTISSSDLVTNDSKRLKVSSTDS
jgi:hypothetical protein